MKELLTGKCKEDFREWAFYNNYYSPKQVYIGIHSNTEYAFSLLPFSCKYGVYLEFFDSVGVYIQILYDEIDSWCYEIYTKSNTYPERLQYDIDNRQEAQQQAIIKANTIYNERH